MRRERIELRTVASGVRRAACFAAALVLFSCGTRISLGTFAEELVDGGLFDDEGGSGDDAARRDSTAADPAADASVDQSPFDEDGAFGPEFEPDAWSDGGFDDGSPTWADSGDASFFPRDASTDG